jgi:response regulator RpfG family c-di-GMP phosphodiesterase
MPIGDKSFAGYVALTGQALNIEDAYNIPGDRPYTHNKDFDRATGYRTSSILTVPLSSSRDKIVGVMQIINALDPSGAAIPFTPEDQQFMNYFATHAAVAIERAQMTREIVLRSVRMAEMRDPMETGSHVNRVGSYAAEIYHNWARKREISEGEIKKKKDLLRIAAMLHDVGKVAISDTILKKPGKLSKEEYETIKHHTTYGAALFRNPTSDLDAMSAEIALNHHQRWDGKGYPDGNQDCQGLDQKALALKEDQPSIYARITALADVYDALRAKRVYKEPWPEEKVLDLINSESGHGFDPDVVQSFLSVYETIEAISAKYQERERD